MASFDWKAFGAAFLGEVTEGIEERGAEAKAYKEKQEAAAERNAAVIQQRTYRAKQAAAYGRQAEAYMAAVPNGRDIVKSAMASGAAGVKDLLDKLQTAANQPGMGGKLGKEDINAIINIPGIELSDLVVSDEFADMSLEEYANITYGAKIGSKLPKVEDDTSIVGQLFGFGAKDRAKQKLAEQDFGNGMTIAEINRLAKGEEYRSLIPEATINLQDLDKFGFEEQSQMSEDVVRAAATDLNNRKSEWDSALLDPADRAGLQDEIRKEAMKREYRRYFGRYKNSGILESEYAKDQIVEALGLDYYTELLVEFGGITQEELDEAKAAAAAKFEAEQAAAAAEAEALAEKTRARIETATTSNDVNELTMLMKEGAEGAPTQEELVERFGPGPVFDAMERATRIDAMRDGSFVVGEDDTAIEAKIRKAIEEGGQDTRESRIEMFNEFGPGPITAMQDKMRREKEEKALANGS
jgi:vacuolar-type H+-ATPase subunit E/Vma4